MAKRLNKQVVGILTIAGMVVTGALMIVFIMYSPKQNPKVYVDQAEEFAKRGEFEEANDRYSRAAQRARADGDNTAANDYSVLAGEMALQAGQADQAIALWKGVVMNNPHHIGAQEKIVGIFLEYAKLGGDRMWAELQKEAQALINIAPENYAGLHAKGLALVRQQAADKDQVEEGKQLLIRAVNGDKSNPEYAQSLAEYYYGEAIRLKREAAVQKDKALDNQSEKALHDTEELYSVLVANPSGDAAEEATAHQYRGRFYLSLKHLREAEAALLQSQRSDPARAAELEERIEAADKNAFDSMKKALDLAPKDVEALVAMGAYWREKRSRETDPEKAKADREKWLAEAEKYYKQAIEADRDHYFGYTELARLYQDQERYDDAVKYLDMRLDRGYKREHYLGWRNRNYMLSLRLQAFNTALTKISRLGVLIKDENERNRERERLIKMMESYCNLFAAETREGENDPIALSMKGRILLIQNDFFGAIKAMEEADKLLTVPDIAADTKRALGWLYLQTGSPGAAEDTLRDLLTRLRPGDVSAWITYARALVQNGKPRDAVAAADEALRLDPGNREALAMKGTAAQQLGDHALAAEIQRTLGLVAAGSPQEKVQQALLLQLKAQESELPDKNLQAQALDLLRQALKQDPANLQGLRLFVGILAYNNEEATRNAAEIGLALDEAVAAVEKQRNQPSSMPADEAKANLDFVARSINYLRIQSDPKVSDDEKIAQMAALIKQGQDPFSVAMELFSLYRRQSGMRDEAAKQIKEAHRLRPDDPAVIDQLFGLALDLKDWPLAEKLRDQAIQQNLDHAGGCFYRGRYLLARTDVERNYERAVDELRAGLSDMASSPQGYIWLGEAYRGLGDNDEARRAYLRAYQLNPQSAAAALGVALVADARGDEDEKGQYLAVCERLIPGHPWVRDQVIEAEDRREPEKGIRRREQIRSENPKDMANLLRLASLYAQVKDFEKAKATYEQCRANEPDNLQVAAMHSELLRMQEPPKMAEAEQVLREALKAVPDSDAAKKTTAQLLLANHMWAAARYGGPGAPTPGDIDAAYLAVGNLSPTPGAMIDIGNYFMRTQTRDYGDPALRFKDGEKWYRKAIEAARAANNPSKEKQARLVLLQMLINSRDESRREETQKEIDEFRAKFPDDPSILLVQGEFQAATARDDLAIEAFTTYVNKVPDPAIGYYRRGFVQFRRGQWARAIEDFQEAKRLNRELDDYRPRLLLAMALVNTGNMEGAVSELQSILDEDENAVAAVQRLFALYLKLGRFDAAANLVGRRSKKEPHNAEWHHLYSQALRLQGKLDESIAEARLAVEKSNSVQFITAALDLVDVHLQTRRFDDLIKYITTELPKERQTAILLMAVGSAYAGKHDHAKAVEWYAKGFESPDANWISLVNAFRQDLQQMLKPEEAITAAQQRLESSPAERGVKLVLAVAYRLSNDNESTARMLNELLETVQGNDLRAKDEKGFLLRELAVLAYEKNEFEKSKTLYEQAIEINPKDVLALNNLAYLLMDKLGQPKLALPYAERAVEFFPNNGGVLDTLGWCLVLMGEYNQGIARLRQAAEAIPGSADLHYHLAAAFYRRSQLPNAEKPDADLAEAKTECQQAHQLIMSTGRDTEGILKDVIALGEKLGLPLSGLPASRQAPG